MPSKVPSTSDMAPGWMRPKSAAQYIDVSLRSLRTYLKEGLRHARFRGSVFIKREWIDEFLEKFEVRSGKEVDRMVEDILKDTLRGNG